MWEEIMRQSIVRWWERVPVVIALVTFVGAAIGGVAGAAIWQYEVKRSVAELRVSDEEQRHQIDILEARTTELEKQAARTGEALDGIKHTTDMIWSRVR